MNAAGQEGAASEASSITIPDGNLMTVAAVNAPSNAVGFQRLRGRGAQLDATAKRRPASGGSELYLCAGQVTQGPLPGKGQKPDFVRPLVRTLLRG